MRLSRTEMLWLAAAVIASGLLRLVLAGRLTIVDDEAYYWLWSQHLAWGYPDHPPMIAALVALSTRLLGDEVLGVRALTALMATVTPLLVYAAGRSLFDHGAAVRGTLIFSILPAFALGTIFAFPDVPLAFFWALGLWTGWRALQAGGWWWVAVGTAAGLALLSKLTAFGFVLGLGGTLAAGGWRRALRDPGFYAGALIAAALFAPVVLWNVQHSWFLADVTLTRERWMAPRSIPENLLLFAGGQIVYYGALAPVLVGAAIVALRRFREPAWRYLVWMSLPVLAATVAAATDAWPKPHWPGPAYLAATLALGALWQQWERRRPRLLWASVGLTALVTGTLAVALLLPWGMERLRAGIGRWDRVAEAVGRQTAAHPGRALVFTDSYQAASHIAYRLRARVPVMAWYGAFIVWVRRDEWAGRTGIYVDEPRASRDLGIQQFCRNVRPVDEVELAPDHRVRLFVCDDVRFP